ncbi:hypothetical protein AG1IA_03735 [Rhizoctonia solani AG-1 IA]|uniref:Uncharacterized protein n=1 Tax=Thanatephorus cucumeris (strain AG1-IA) TaxID=983506 RepID=L8WW80_THACA|nr:hypothetical protein AG1IA_03735 [Rhizoctonia solani AG-1 IA]
MVSEQITKTVLERAPKPTFPNYEQRGRPLSYQPRFYEVDKQPANNYGFPEPGIQVCSNRFTAKDFMVSDLTWEDLCVNGKDAIDYIVIGSGVNDFVPREGRFVRFTKVTYHGGSLQPIDFWLPDHFQNLPLPFKYTLGGPSETFPFTLSEKTFNSPVRFVHGSTPFFGGRSTFWSAWSPSPDEKLMRGWPKSMIDTSKEPVFFKDAIELLRVTNANEIGPPYYCEGLQKQVHERLSASLSNIPTANKTCHAPMSVSPMAQTSTVRFTKFSTPGPLLGLYKKQQNLVKADPNKASPLLFATNTAVEFLITDVGYPGKVHEASKDKTVTLVRSSRHTDLPVSEKTKIILCAGLLRTPEKRSQVIF